MGSRESGVQAWHIGHGIFYIVAKAFFWLQDSVGLGYHLESVWPLTPYVFDPGKCVNRVCVVGGRSDEQAPREPAKHFPFM